MALSFSFAAHAAEVSGDCDGLYARLKKIFSGPTITQTELTHRSTVLGNVPLKDFFSDFREIKGGKHAGRTIKATPKDVAKFNRAWDRFFNIAKNIDSEGVGRDADQFRTWLRMNSGATGGYPKITSAEFENEYVKTEKTLKDFFYDQYYLFVKSESEKAQLPMARRFISVLPRSIPEAYGVASHKVGGLASRTVTIGASIVLASTIAGPMEGLWTGFTKMNADKGKELGATIARKTTGLFEGFEGGKDAYSATLKKIESQLVDYQKIDLLHLDRMEARKQIRNIEEEIGKNLQKYSQVLDQIDDRRPKGILDDLSRKSMSTLPLAITNISRLTAALKDLDEKIEARDGKITAKEKEEKDSLTQEVVNAQHSLSRAIATWKVYKLSLPPANQILPDDIDGLFGDEYNDIMRTMDQEIYREEFLKMQNEYLSKLKDYNK